MTSNVYVSGVETKNSAAGWKKSNYKSVPAWMAGTGAKKIRIPGLNPAGTYCFVLPNGRRVEAELLDEKTMRVTEG